MRFEWDPAKAASNLAKHGVAFEAAEDFEWGVALVQATLRHVGGEPRIEALAPIGARLHVLVCTLERGCVRIISLRKANNREVDCYEAET